MIIDKILDEPLHKVYCYITYRKVFMREWIADDCEDIGISVLRITYNRGDEDTDKFYWNKRKVNWQDEFR